MNHMKGSARKKESTPPVITGTMTRIPLRYDKRIKSGIPTRRLTSSLVAADRPRITPQSKYSHLDADLFCSHSQHDANIMRVINGITAAVGGVASM
jgi:hypothetical protein